jgi:enhancing lycopene biosynthesis protein 2
LPKDFFNGQLGCPAAGRAPVSEAAMVKVGVVLSGCGYLDGAEIQEAVLTALYLEQEGADVAWAAPDMQAPVVDHLTGRDIAGQTRSVLAESARIARGDIVAVDKLRARDLDALVLPGGYGAAKNLCDFALKGPQCTVHPAVEALVREVHAAGKPIGAICIAPAVIAKVLGAEHPSLTIGDDANAARGLEACGAKHERREVDEITVDRKLRIVSTPAWMLGPRCSDVAKGIEKLCKEVVAMARQPAASR